MVALVQIFISVNPMFVVYFYVSAMSCTAEIPNPVAGRVCKIIVLLIQILVLLPPAAKINFKSKKGFNKSQKAGPAAASWLQKFRLLKFILLHKNYFTPSRMCLQYNYQLVAVHPP